MSSAESSPTPPRPSAYASGPGVGDGLSLLPPSGPLVPPSGAGGIAGDPPSGSAGAQDYSLGELSEGLVRARQAARGAVQHVFSVTSEHAPEIKRTAAAAADAARETAGAAMVRARDAADRARAGWSRNGNTPGQRRKILAGSAVILAVLVAGGWYIAAEHATSVAQREVAIAMSHYGLRPYLSYGDVTGSPFGSATLHGVKLHIDTLNVPADSCTIKYVSSGPGNLEQASMTLIGVTLPVVELRRLGMLPSEAAAQLLGLGLLALKLDAQLNFATRHEDDFSTVGLSLTSSEIGSLGAHLRIGGLPGILRAASSLTAEQISGMMNGLPPLNALELVQSALSLSFEGGDITIEDTPIAARMRQIPIDALPPSPDDRAHVVGRARGDSLAMELAGVVPADQADATEKLVNGWVSDGGRLVVKSDPPAPIPLLKHGDFANLTIPELNQSISLSDAGITVSD